MERPEWNRLEWEKQGGKDGREKDLAPPNHMVAIKLTTNLKNWLIFSQQDGVMKDDPVWTGLMKHFL